MTLYETKSSGTHSLPSIYKRRLIYKNEVLLKVLDKNTAFEYRYAEEILMPVVDNSLRISLNNLKLSSDKKRSI